MRRLVSKVEETFLLGYMLLANVLLANSHIATVLISQHKTTTVLQLH